MIDKDGGGTIFQFYRGNTAVMRGDIELMGDPPTGENPDVINLPCTFIHYLELANFQFYFMIWIVVF